MMRLAIPEIAPVPAPEAAVPKLQKPAALVAANWYEAAFHLHIRSPCGFQRAAEVITEVDDVHDVLAIDVRQHGSHRIKVAVNVRESGEPHAGGLSEVVFSP